MHTCHFLSSLFFFFNDTATTEIYTLSLHDALPISRRHSRVRIFCEARCDDFVKTGRHGCLKVRSRCNGRGQDAIADSLQGVDRKSTRLNSSHSQISYAVFCLKKKKKDYSIHLYSTT